MKEHILSGKVPLYYRKNNFKKNRKTIVFIHGLSGSSGAWIPYEKKLEKDFNILSFDLRGHGKSYKPRKYGDYELNKFVEDMYRLIKHEKIKKFMMISHSFASLIALEFLKNHENLVEKAILISPTYKAPRGKLAFFVKGLLRISKPIWPPIPKRTGCHVDYNNHKNTTDWNIPRLIKDVKSTSLPVYLTCSLHSYNFNAEELLDKIKIPVLLIHGKKDTIFSHEDSIYMNQKIKKSKIILIDDIDHIIVLNKVNEVSKYIQEFLKK